MDQQQSKRRRIPCPIDPTHWIAHDAVEKHILICPKTKQQSQQAALPYYCQDCNAGGYGNKQEEDNHGPLSLSQAQVLARLILQTHERLFGSISTAPNTKEEASPIRDVTKLTLEDIEASLPLQDYSTNDTTPAKNENANIDNELSLLFLQQQQQSSQQQSQSQHKRQIRLGTAKHIRQQTSLLGHLERSGCATAMPNKSSNNNNRHTIVEVGAGRGMMGLVAAGVLASAQATKESSTSTTELLFVERTGSRGKADTVLRNFDGTNTSDTKNKLRLDLVQWKRAACDLQHLDLSKALTTSFVNDTNNNTSINRGRRLHILGKHVCGVGTDLSLKSLEPLVRKGADEKTSSTKILQSCIMATCCHGVCFWKDYVGREFLQKALIETAASTNDDNNDSQYTFGPAEFECARKWCAASVATRSSSSANPSESSQSSATMQDENDEHNIEMDDNESNEINGTVEPQTRTGVVSVSTVVESLGLACGKNGLGRACQRLLDYGRVQYMQHVLHFDNVKLVHYVPSSVTPQNAVLVGYNHMQDGG